MAAWGEEGRGGRHPTPQLPSYKLNEAKQNHPDGDTGQKQTTLSWMYGAVKKIAYPWGMWTKLHKKVVAVGEEHFRAKTTSCRPTWSVPPATD